MNVVHVYKDYYPVVGGIENHVKVLAEEQARRGHQVAVLAANRGRRFADRVANGVRTVLVPRLGTLCSTPISPGFFTALPRLAPDLVHLHFPHPPGELAQLLARPRRPTVITYHSDVVRQRRLLRLYRPVLRRVLDAASRIIATSPRYALSSELLQARSAKCRVVPLGIQVERFDDPLRAAGQAARARWGIPADRFLVVFVGRLRYYKGLGHLLEMMTRLPRAHLLLVGDGPLGTWCRERVATLGIAERVSMTGEVTDEDLPGCYLAGDVFVLPSTLRAEAFGTTIVEAMASGLPVVTTEIETGTSWVNQHRVTGLVVPPADTGALAEAVEALARDGDLRHAMGRAGRARVEQQFRAETMVDGVERVYQEALACEGPALAPSP
jgi:rhamnosyl/mannosyltransferase